MRQNVLNEKAREAIHKAVQRLNPFDRGDTQTKVNMGAALELTKKHVYSGTANSNKVTKRRAKSKVASKSRRNNRG